ncbi:MAG: 5' nucleotidase, NT5C type [Thermodesulfobacteriota bacterium]
MSFIIVKPNKKIAADGKHMRLCRSCHRLSRRRVVNACLKWYFENFLFFVPSSRIDIMTLLHTIPAHGIGFDIDCVVADTMEAFIRLAAEEHKISIAPEEITAFQVEDCLAVDKAIIDTIFNRLLCDPISCGLKPMTGAVAVLSRLAARAPLTFVTARPTAEPIIRWLQTVLPTDVSANMRLIAMGDHDTKADCVRALGIQYFVDDRVETCLQMACSGLTPVVFDQPWNVGRHNLTSVHCWDSLGNLLI